MHEQLKSLSMDIPGSPKVRMPWCDAEIQNRDGNGPNDGLRRSRLLITIGLNVAIRSIRFRAEKPALLLW